MVQHLLEVVTLLFEQESLPLVAKVLNVQPAICKTRELFSTGITERVQGFFSLTTADS